MQQNHRDTAHVGLIDQPQSGHHQFDAGVGAVGWLETVDVLDKIAATLGADQGNGKKLATALHITLYLA
ncbi:hypothetical protein PsgRace4_15529 [Pseudomonas savastanoi pv. glycinea str. race 4]|nr:hypothetical protein PsgRace4_15529 [Pseudomonas savastanoi pv. glycinea str. race 4]